MDGNTTCKLSGMIIILGISMAIWFLYNRFIRKRTGDSFEFILFNFPEEIKCFVPDVALKTDKNDCGDADFDGWSILHVIIYLVLGALFPGEYGLVLVISFLSEFWEYISGWRARWLVDPIVNMASYWVGSQLSYKFGWDICKKYQIPKWLTLLGVVMLITFMGINNPEFIGLREQKMQN